MFLFVATVGGRLLLQTYRSHLGYETITLQTTLLSTLPSQISSLQATISSLQASSPSKSPSSSPNLSLPLPDTLSLLSTRETELAQIEQQIKTLQQMLPGKVRELEKAENDLKMVEAQRDKVATEALEATKRREEGGGGNELERTGRWLKGIEAGLRGMLEVKV